MIDQPLRLPSGLELSNRLAKSAMGEVLADVHDDVTPQLIRLYQRFATSGASLLITGNMVVDRQHPARPGDVALDGQTRLEPLAAMAAAAKSAGAKILVQLNHAGRQTPRLVNPAPLAPSGGVAAVKMLGAFGKPREMSEADIQRVIDGHVRAAKLLQQAGFDGVQIHAAHGYLLSQFLSPITNRRTDGWGGTPQKRARLLLELHRQVKAATGAGFTVAVKLNSADFMRGGFSEEESLDVASMLDAEGLDLLEISGGNYESVASFGRLADSTRQREAYFMTFAEAVRKRVKAPLLLTGGFRSRDGMVQAVRDGVVDLVGIARPMAVQPELPAQLLKGGVGAMPLRTSWLGIRKLESAAEIAFYVEQLKRMSQGLDPNPRMSAWWALLQYLKHDALYGRARRRAAKQVMLPVVAEAVKG